MTGDDDIRLASGAEMRLIEAEALLQAGDWPGAMAIIDGLRASYGLSNLMVDFPEAGLPPASDVATAMSYLMRERGIEPKEHVVGFLRRWLPEAEGGEGQGLGGDVDLANFEATSSLFHGSSNPATPRSICSDVPDSERDSNPNVPSAQAG